MQAIASKHDCRTLIPLLRGICYLEAFITVIGARHICHSAQELVLCFVVSFQVAPNLFMEVLR